MILSLRMLTMYIVVLNDGF